MARQAFAVNLTYGTRHLVPALFVLLQAVSQLALRAQTPGADQDLRRIDSLLIDQATALLERYGDTFYVLGLYITHEDETLGIATRHWASLQAPPDEWRDSLLVAFDDYLPDIRSAGYLLDRWRQLEPARQDSTYAVFHFETPAGRCVETRRRYEWKPDGLLSWSAVDTLPCRLSIWSRKPNQ